MWHNVLLKGIGLVYRPDNNSDILYQTIYNDIKDKIDLHILEVGCGSGAISLALKQNTNNNFFTMSDINDIAISYAKQNAQLNNLEENITIIESDMFKNIPYSKYDIIFANIPFFTYNDGYDIFFNMFVPMTGYIVGNSSDEDVLLKELIIQSSEYLNNHGIIYFQTGDIEQRNRMTELLKQNGFTNIEYFNTNTNKPLFIKAEYVDFIF